MAGQKGAVALYNYRTGDILCMLSTPAYDPDDKAEIARVDAETANMTAPISTASLLHLHPGSTFKLVTSAAALETLHNESSFSYTCSGSLTVNGEKITCPSVHGSQNFASALANSCNGAFATLAIEVGGGDPEKLCRVCRPAAKRQRQRSLLGHRQFHRRQRQNALGWSGVGQYEDLVNPAQS